jgi:hypothetical protein
VIIAVITMRMMQLPAYEVIDMVAVRYGFVPAVWTVLMGAADFRRAAHGIFGGDRNHMFVDMTLMHMMKMAIVKIVDMAVMADGGVAAVRAMFVGMVGVVLFSTGGHTVFSYSLSAACLIAFCTNRRTGGSDRE